MELASRAKEFIVRQFKVTSLLLAGALVVMTSTSASADRGHGRQEHFHHHNHFGVFIGAPLFWDPFYPWPYYYRAYPPVVVAPSGPTTYIEQGGEGLGRAEAYWYYCPDSKSYYPYVRECPGGWQREVPRPPPN